MLNPIQVFHIVVSLEIRGATSFIAVSSWLARGLNLSVKNVYVKCTLPRYKKIAAPAPIKIREIMVWLLSKTNNQLETCVDNCLLVNIGNRTKPGTRH